MSEEKEGGKLGQTSQRPLWGLYFSILARGVHQFGAALFLAACLFPERLPLVTWQTVLAGGSGLLLLAAEGARHRQIYREFSGCITIGKCLLLGVALHTQVAPGLLVSLAFLLAAVAAHAPRHIRHRLLY